MRLDLVPTHHASLELSFEFFPPKGPKGAAAIAATAHALKALSPGFCSVTYGAGGTTQTGTLETASAIAAEALCPPAAHLTAVGASRADVNRVADGFWQAGVHRIVALRGDAQDADGRYRAHPQGYVNAADLVRGLKRRHDFDISVAAYPEKHPESHSVDADIDNLKAKFDAGADRALTQFFFDPEAFLRFRDRAAARGVWHPIVPGILPIRDIAQVQVFAARCGAVVPAWVVEAFDGTTDQADRHRVAIDLAASLCERLLRHGVRDFHFYTLNKADLTVPVCERLIGGAESDSLIAAAAAWSAQRAG